MKKELKELRTANPKDLNPTYRRLYANNVIQRERQNTAKTYRLILSAYTPLTLKQVTEAVSIEDDGKINDEVNEEYIRKRCHSFVTENEDGYLQFAHESARLFLEKVENHGDKDFVDVDDFSDTANHREMAEICLKLMMRPNHPMWLPSKPSPVQQNGRFGCPSRVAEMNYRQKRDILHQCLQREGFCNYALPYLGNHCRKLGSTHSLGPKLSRDLINVIFEPNTAFLWWYDFAYSYGAHQSFGLPAIRIQGLDHRRRLRKEVFACMQNDCSPNPFLAVCMWDLAECVDELRAHLFPKCENWSSAPQLPLDVCCLYGSRQTLSKLITLYPGKMDALIMEPHGPLGKIPIEVAVENLNVNTARHLLEFERKQAHTTEQERWTSNQLLSLCPLSKRITAWSDPDITMMLKLLFEFEADQTGARFPPRPGECWVSELAQYPDRSGFTPLQFAAKWADPDVVSLLLQAGARLTRTSETARHTALEAALEREDANGPKVVKLLLPRNPADWNIFACDESFVEYLAGRSTVEMATHILQKRPELVQRWNWVGEKAIKIASRRRDHGWIRQAGLTRSHYQELINVMLKFGARLADAQESPEEMIKREEDERRWERWKPNKQSRLYKLY